jgi:predicted lactoylglutathione lyase
MPKMIFVNLPVADVAASTVFYAAIGFEKNAHFSNEQSSSVVWSDDPCSAARETVLCDVHRQDDR